MTLLSSLNMDDVAAALAVENSRLREEARRLRARVLALESSRWYRLNPRRLLERRTRSADGIAPSRVTRVKEPTLPPAHAPAELDLRQFETEVVERGRFTALWALRHAASWEPIFAALDEREASILEVGTFEGLWACLAAWRLPRARITCVDTFAGGLEHVGTDTRLDGLEQIFDSNVALVGSSRVSKRVGDSQRVLRTLLSERERFDLIYVDGSHLGLDVLVDAALSWQLLVTGGFIVFDDYMWDDLGADPLLRPGPAIDAFHGILEGKYEKVFSGEQVASRKIA